MRTTVGPLPAGVYWRRRLVVLAALLVGVLGVVYACSGSEARDGDQPGNGSAGRVPTSDTPSEDVLAPEGEPSFEESGPPDGPGGADLPAGPATDETGPATDPGAACTDDEIRVTPVPARGSVRRGEPVGIRLRIRNVSSRNCSRDVGADLQEIYVGLGVRKVWSSDGCGLAKGSDVQRLVPNLEREYRVTWNGRTSTRCTGGSAAGPAPAAGSYQVFGRLGTKISKPVPLSIVG